MISAWHLLWIIPLVGIVSFFIAALCFAAKDEPVIPTKTHVDELCFIRTCPKCGSLMGTVASSSYYGYAWKCPQCDYDESTQRNRGNSNVKTNS